MRRLRSTQPNPPRGIAVSGYGTDADKQMTREAGFEAHLTKPIKVADLDTVLHEAAAAR
jgi:CheY-like chemotaxis protein